LKKTMNYTKTELQEIKGVTFTFGICGKCNAEVVTGYRAVDKEKLPWDVLRAQGFDDHRIAWGTEQRRVRWNRKTAQYEEIPTGVTCHPCLRIESEVHENKVVPRYANKIAKTVKAVYLCPVCERHDDIVKLASKGDLVKHLKEHKSEHLAPLAKRGLD
jgi:hypothetical protein